MPTMNPVRRGNLSVAIVTAVTFVLTGLFVTHWGAVATVVGAVCLLVFVFGVSELVTRRRQRASSSER
jgi:hypothetical protein